MDLALAAGTDARWAHEAVVALADVVDAEHLPTGDWDEPPLQALAVPLPAQGTGSVLGFVVAAVNRYRPLDANYLGFLRLAAQQVAAHLVTARALDAERRRAAELAELDRAKTQFFTNVSHELRTPLTLILGPTEDALAEPDGQVPAVLRRRLQVVHRNARRLLTLVGTLLDISRLESGAVQVHLEPVDLSALTADLAETFRGAVERVGLTLRVDCPPLSTSVQVDAEMWAKVVLNLIFGGIGGPSLTGFALSPDWAYAGTVSIRFSARLGTYQGWTAQVLDACTARLLRSWSGVAKGTVSTTWDGRDSAGTLAPPGLYTLRYLSEGQTRSVSAELVRTGATELAGCPLTRVFGADRYATSVAAGRALFAAGEDRRARAGTGQCARRRARVGTPRQGAAGAAAADGDHRAVAGRRGGRPGPRGHVGLRRRRRGERPGPLPARRAGRPRARRRRAGPLRHQRGGVPGAVGSRRRHRPHGLRRVGAGGELDRLASRRRAGRRAGRAGAAHPADGAAPRGPGRAGAPSGADHLRPRLDQR
ncbi:MAG TPA: histidine kinase dimerization/phospho-acceptor domain-containing protein, partial [Motilibacteraceae bacterium]|nr:histidine kinase dimerization/phospho-acceptor domain-containing protein [Motilibacteraceae bacterium]